MQCGAPLLGAIVAAPLLVAGCIGPFDTRDFIEFKPAPEQTREIDTVRFEDRSVTPPQTIEEGTAEMLAAVLAPQPPPETVTLTLEDVRAAALEHNLDLRVELLSPSIARTAVDEEEARFESVLTASVRRDVVDSPTITPSIQGTQNTFTSYDLGVRIPLRTGGTATVSFPFSETETNNPAALVPTSYNAALRFSISQPLLRGAGNWVNTHPIRVAKYQYGVSSAQTKLEAMRILANADRAYWRLYAAKRALDVSQQQYELAMAQLERARRRVRAGDAPEIEVIRAQSGVAQRLEAIIISDNAVRRGRRDLKRIMNRPDLPINSATAITLASEVDPVGYELDGDELAAVAVRNRMEMLELELQLAIDASTIGVRRNAKLPLITLDYVYNATGLGTGLHSAWSQALGRNFENWTLAVGAEIPLGNEAAQAQLHRALLERVQRLATKEQRDLAIRQEVYDAVDQIRQNWQRILAARQDSLLAGETLDAEQRQFDVGARTSTDVLDAATRLADAQRSEILALTDYQIAQIDLAFATGTLLGYERIRWEAEDVEWE